ncbi:MAG TPA: hypothetical protein GXX75_06750 [Clostridiales bacterium]|nr:hypothetical protein [Clostridiales bacterium]
MAEAKIMKVQFKYSIPGYYKNQVYRQKTMQMEIPTDDYGFTLPGKLSENITQWLRENVDVRAVLIWHRIIN